MILRLSIKLSLISIAVSLTPPKILFGGWTPILPGHPFYFGPVRRKFSEEPNYQNQVQYVQNVPHAVQHFHSPNANYENEHMEQGEYAHPDNHQQYETSHGTYDPNCKPSHESLHYDSPHEPSHYEAPHDPSHYEASREPSQFESPREPTHYEPPEENSHYEPPEENSHYERPHDEPSNAVRFKHSKDIFAYYPPQSAYDGPPQNENLDYKPVYLEVPRKPLDIYENPHQNVPYILPNIKDVPIKDLNLNDFNSIQHGNGKTFFKITSLGQVDPKSVKHLGHINIDKVRFIPNSFNKQGYHMSQVAFGKNNIPNNGALPHNSLSHGGKYIPNIESNYNLVNLDNIKSGKGQLHYAIEQPHIAHKPMNNFRGTSFPHVHSDIMSNNLGNIYENQNLRNPRLLNYPSPQELKSLKDSTSANFINQNDYKSQKFASNSFPTPPVQIYTPNHELFKDVQYLTQSNPLKGTKTNFFSPKNIGKSLANQMKNYLGPKVEHFGSIQPFYSLGTPKTLILPGKLPFNMPLSPMRNPLQTFKSSLMPNLLRNNLHKNVKVDGLYRDPSVLTNVGGTPAIVERAVAIIHVPVSTQPRYLNNAKGYPNEENLLYLASTPESTEIRNFQNLNKSNHYMSLGGNLDQFATNETYSKNLQEMGNEPKMNSHTSVDEPAGQNQFIFVGTQGINSQGEQNIRLINNVGSEKMYFPEDENKKHFFHAYYAPSDHVPPKGYVKMTTEEFNKLFKHAEIRYIDKEPIDLLRYPNDGNRENPKL